MRGSALCLVLALTGCTEGALGDRFSVAVGEPAPHEALASNPLRGGFAFTLGDITPGEDLTFMADGVPEGTVVWFAISLGGAGDGICPPALNGTCLDILNPIYQLGNGTADATGHAEFTITVPSDVTPGTEVWGQAIGNLGETWVTSNVVPSVVGGGCEVDDQLSVNSFDIVVGDENQVELEVGLNRPAAVAGMCVSNSEQDQIFFAESSAPALNHTVQLSGLIAAHTYTCTAAPVCPEMIGGPAVDTVTLPNPPGSLHQMTMTENPAVGMWGSWTLGGFQGGFSGGYIGVYGPEGRIRWWYDLPNGVADWLEARWHPDIQKMVWGGGMSPQGSPTIVDIHEGTEYQFRPQGWQSDEHHHDGKRIDDGRLMSLEYDSANNGQTSWQGFRMRIFDADTDVVSWDLRSQTLVDNGGLQYTGGFDPWHANWMDWVDTPRGEEVYVSLCYSDQILGINVDTQEVILDFGPNKGWTVIDENGDSLGQSALPQCQHGLEIDDNFRMLVYDNGTDRRQSQLQEWQLDPDTMVAQRLFMWTESGWFERIFGDADYVGPDHFLVTIAGQLTRNEIVEVTRDGEIASRMVMNSGETYRADRYDGCDMFTSVKECNTLAARFAQVADLIRP